MTKTLIDVDDAALAEAAEVLGTVTKKQTVNAALRETVALARRREHLKVLRSGGLSDLGDPQVTAGAWR